MEEKTEKLPGNIEGCDLCVYSKGRKDINCYRNGGCGISDGEYYSHGNNFNDLYYNNVQEKNTILFEFKGTNGKWNHLDKSDLSIWADTGNKICEIVDKRHLGETLMETWYNAKLISKAPELLEFIKNIYIHLNLENQEKAIILIKEVTEL